MAGHRPIAVAGGATGMIGDPSGKSAERNLLSAEALEANIAGIQGQLRRLLDFESKTNPALLLNNADWVRPSASSIFCARSESIFPSTP
jgi:tyrosyl-tRNA synthetase